LKRFLLSILLLTAVFSFAVFAEDEAAEVDMFEESSELSTDDPFADAFLDPFAEPVDDEDLNFLDDPFAVPDDETSKKTPDKPKVETSGEEIISFDDFDSMFDTDEMIDVVTEEEASADVGAADEFLLSDGVEFGGKFSGSLPSSWDYENLYTTDFDITDPAASMTPSVTADLFFDARPNTNYRVFGKFGFTTASGDAANVAALIPEGGFTFEQTTDEDGNQTFQTINEEDQDSNDPDQTTITQDDVAGDDTSTQLNISVKELFADFDWEDMFYFRFGKSMIKWGVGYFWSPSDVLNLTSINVEDPTADREGPISFKMHYPFDIHNAYLYLIAENVEEPFDTAVAAKAEFVVGDTEFGIGAYYQRDLAPRAVGTVSTSIGDIAIFGEGVASWGSDRVFVRPSKDQSAAEDDLEDDLEIVLDTYTVDEGLFFSGTIGANYMYDFEDDGGSLMLIGQYYFNGEGYDGSTPGLLEAAAHLSQNAGDNGLTLPAGEQPEGYEDPPEVGTGDISGSGQHYAGLMVSWSSILGSDAGFSMLTIANLTDLSGMVIPSFSFKLIDYLSMSAGMRLTFGEEGDEYTNPAALFGLGGADAWAGPTMSFTLEFTVGGGSF
jgi:hypothetical protein